MLLMNLVSLVLALASFQKAEPQTPGPLVWTGALSRSVTGSQNVMLPQEQDAAGYAAMLRASLADLTTRVEISRDFASQLPALEWLRAEACWQADYPGKAEIAADITVVRANWLEKLGRHDEAVYAAQHAYVMPEETGQEPYAKLVWLPSEGRLAELVNRTDALPAMVELHKRFPSGATSKKAEDPIDEVVRRECLAGSANNLYSFGARCVPGLLRLLREDPKRLGELYSVEHPSQPLAILTAIDRASAGSLLLSTLGKRGPDWTMRAIFSFSNALVTKQVLVRSPDAHAPNTTSDALTLKVVDAIARENLPAPRFVQLLEPLVGNDIVSPAVRDFLLELVPATDPALLAPLRSMLDGVRVGPNKRALYEAFLDSPDPELRWRCADALPHYDVGPATLRASRSVDPRVRQAVTHALVSHAVAPYDYVRNARDDDGAPVRVVVQRTPEIETALLALARDGELSVRQELLGALRDSRERPPEALLAALLADESPAIRGALAAGWRFDLELQRRVFETLAADTSAFVLDSVAVELAACAPGRKSVTKDDIGSYPAAVAKLLANPKLGSGSGDCVARMLDAALKSRATAGLVVAALASSPRAQDIGALLPKSVTWIAHNPGDVSILSVLDAPQISVVFAHVISHGDDQTLTFLPLALEKEVSEGRAAPGPFLALVLDESQPRDVRLRALQCAASRATALEMKAYAGLLRSVDPEELERGPQGSRGMLGLLLSPFNRLRPEALEGFAATVLSDRGIADLVAVRVASAAIEVTRERLEAAPIAAAVERWNRLGESQRKECVQLLPALDPSVDARVVEIWRRDGRRLADRTALYTALGRYPVDEGVDVLVGLITLSEQYVEPGYREAAIGILTRRLDDLGADGLLRAIAGATYTDVRTKCFEGLEQIRKYQDEKQNWQTRRNGQAARDAAVAELLPLLGDKDPVIRAAAARSLATLRATEHLPRLVALLRDADASVREAAQKALDVLNAPETKKP